MVSTVGGDRSNGMVLTVSTVSLCVSNCPSRYWSMAWLWRSMEYLLSASIESGLAGVVVFGWCPSAAPARLVWSACGVAVNDGRRTLVLGRRLGQSSVCDFCRGGLAAVLGQAMRRAVGCWRRAVCWSAAWSKLQVLPFFFQRSSS